ncbi:MAG: succinate dehydrogenase cytochrome b subunit [Actinomycetaceae bacterium]|nr:succinate dehydrogenase cytochrome b subunit [Actinomycetaceae bacterium]
MTIHGRVWSPRDTSPPRPSNWVLKATMSVTGIIMAAFVLIHMLGNLKIFSSHTAFNAYSQWLREVLYPLLPYEGLLWIARLTLGLCLAAHVWAALVVWMRSRRNSAGGRPRGVDGWLAKLMLPTGLVILAFVVIHILDLTIGRLVAPVEFQHPDPQFHAAANLVASLDRPVMAILYLTVLIAVALHVAHGIQLAVNDLGATSQRLRVSARIVGYILALLILVGDSAVVLSAHLGVV